MNKILGTVLALFTLIGTAHADPLYVTGGYNNSAVNGQGTRENGFGGGVGFGVTDWLGVEATYDYLGNENDTKKESIGVWGVVDHPTAIEVVGMPLKVVGRVGYTRNRIGSMYDNGLAYGLGVGVEFTGDIDVIASATRRELDTSNLDTLSVGVKYSF